MKGKMKFEQFLDIADLLSAGERKIPEKELRRAWRIITTIDPAAFDGWIEEGHRMVAEAEAKKAAIG